MELGADHTRVRVLLKHFHQAFDEAGGKFRIVVDNEEVFARCGADAHIIPPGKTEVLSV
jgi:hypothetical protein